MDSKTNKEKEKADARFGSKRLVEEDIDFMHDAKQFSSSGGLNTSEMLHMQHEDEVAADKAYADYKASRMGKALQAWDKAQYRAALPLSVTGVVVDGKIVSLPSRLVASAGTDAAGRIASESRGDKGLCVKCNCVVRLEGHEARCVAPRRESLEDSDLFRKMAWLGDGLHSLDVKRYLVAIGVETSQLEVRAQYFRSKTMRARYFRDNPGDWHGYDPDQVSDVVVANLFGASYVGQYRKDYLRAMLDLGQQSVWFPGRLAVYFEGFPYL